MTADGTVVQPVTGDGDRFRHYVPKPEIVRAAVEGVPARAICGKVWVPLTEGAQLPVCPDCQAIYDSLEAG
ncbi:DUF3039 domain-containing protein [Galbitalea sp. SE-J8]|uniref:DUF3039 domain-containing protein n=1 Tax=Galbitalea sp. SE-J8 TaxID=3054952 RepID=UPI00259D2775|nr:DUF3039 domain-containing protein [Galbitalea sp. SE-J8]MDM4761902.1 DUF3039 domain-containing protein [Galbitalea sp. SE-J8]